MSRSNESEGHFKAMEERNFFGLMILSRILLFVAFRNQFLLLR